MAKGTFCVDSFLKKIMEKNYNPPQIEIIQVFVERGYSASNNDGGGISAPGWG